MEDWPGRTHHYIAQGSPALHLIPHWVLNRAIDYHIDRDVNSGPLQRKIECYEFDPYCFAPNIDGYHGHLAYGKLALPFLKKKLTECKNARQIGILLNTLCSEVHRPEQAVLALKLNFLYQICRMLNHSSWYIRQRSMLALKILAGQPSGRVQIVNNRRLMLLIIASLNDSTACVRWTTYDLIHRLSLYYFAVPKLLEFGFIRIMIDILKDNHTRKVEEIKGEFEEVEEEENDPEARNPQSKHWSTKIQSGASDSTSGTYWDQKASTVSEKHGKDIVEHTVQSGGESGPREVYPEMEVVDEQEELGEDDGDNDTNLSVISFNNKSCTLNNQSRCVLVTLIDTLLNLMNANANATLDAICYDVIHLKQFFKHGNINVRLLTMRVFRQIFTTDVGKMALIPHGLLNQILEIITCEQTNLQEFEEAMGALMLALIKVENLVEAVKWGILDKLLDHLKKFNTSSSQHLAELSVLTHLAELPEMREQLRTKLNLIGSTIIFNNNPDVAHQIELIIEQILWQP